MRKAVIYNYLLEATIIASIAIVLMLILRRLLRKQLGSRVIAFAWLLVAIRLLCPLSLPNPAINEIRSPFATDEAMRPISGQVYVRFSDFVSDLDRLYYRYDLPEDSLFVQAVDTMNHAVYTGDFATVAMWVWLVGACGVAGWFLYRNIRFRHMLRAGRVEALTGKVEMEYHQLCVKRKVNPLPVFYTDPLPSACLVGVFQPYIALPLTSKPNETIHVLEHEICHYKGWDHVWGLVRLLCCVIHWFNPLVWLAASLSMTDCELACDERVTKGMDEDRRKEYASVLVLAAARRNAPGLPVLATGMTMTGKRLRERVRSIMQNKQAVKWLAIGFAILASVLLVFAFATSEYHPAVRFAAADRAEMASIKPASITTHEEATVYAEKLFGSPYLQVDLTDAAWEADRKHGGFEVSARTADEHCDASFLTDGTVVHFYHAENESSGMVEPVPGKVTGHSWEELADYLLGFLDYALPGHSNWVEAFREGEVYEMDGGLYAQMTGQMVTSLGVEDAYTFEVRVDGDAPRMSWFRMEQPVLARLWQKEIDDLASPEAHRLNGLVARAYTNREQVTQTQPPEDASVEEMLQYAMNALYEKYGETPEALLRFQVYYRYVDGDKGDYYYETPHWVFDFDSISPSDFYTVIVHAPDGGILYTSGRGEGNG